MRFTIGGGSVFEALSALRAGLGRIVDECGNGELFEHRRAGIG
jgi:hypothetical protein